MENHPQDNPYSSSQADELLGSSADELPPRQLSGLVGHVRILAILMVIQGAAEVLMGLLVVGFGANMPLLSRQPEAATGLWVVTGVIGSIHLISALFFIFAGLRVYQFRGLALAWTALIGGLATLIGCYCFFTAIPLLIYGAIVLANASVGSAFQMGRRGFSAEEIQRTFTARS